MTFLLPWQWRKKIGGDSKAPGGTAGPALNPPCRDFEVVVLPAPEMLRSALQARSVILLGGRRRWRRTAEGRVAAYIHRLGCQVLFVGIAKG